MGYYLNCNSKGKNLPAIGKAKLLIEDGANVIGLEEIQFGDVAVVENDFFDAALFIDDYEVEYLKTYNTDGHDERPITYLRYKPAIDIIKASYSNPNLKKI